MSNIEVRMELPSALAATKVKFNATNGEYTLTEVWRGDAMSGQQLYPVK